MTLMLFGLGCSLAGFYALGFSWQRSFAAAVFFTLGISAIIFVMAQPSKADAETKE